MRESKISDCIIKEGVKQLSKNIDESIKTVEKELNKKIEDFSNKFSGKISLLDSYSTMSPLVVNLGTVEKPELELVHEKFDTIIRILSSTKRKEKNIMLVGEAGSGKTHLVSSVAKALNRKFYPMSVGLQTTKSDLLGFINAYGAYITTPIREAFEKGGILLLDEFDATHAGVVTILNSLLANNHCSFPDGIIEKHKDFICICACNTYGNGGNLDYIGRNKLDGATLDRFITLEVGYDEKLEHNLTCNEKWENIIKSMRKKARTHGIKIIISPRASMDGADLLDAGFSVDEVINMVVLKGANKDIRNVLIADSEEIVKPLSEVTF